MLQEYRKSDKEAIEKAKAVRAIQEPTNFAHLRQEEANQQIEHSALNHPEQAEQVKVFNPNLICRIQNVINYSDK